MVEASRFRIQQAEAAVAGAGVSEKDSRLIAPFDGVISAKLADPGSLASPGTPILKIESTDVFRVDMIVPESFIQSIALSQTVSVSIPSAGGKPFEGTIRAISPAADAASRSFMVQVAIPFHPAIHSGMFSRVTLDRGNQEKTAHSRKRAHSPGTAYRDFSAGCRSDRPVPHPADGPDIRDHGRGPVRNPARRPFRGDSAAGSGRWASGGGAVMTQPGIAGKIAGYFINSKLTPLFIIASVLLGIAAVIALPREEEPQIIVPMIDVFVKMPGASAKEVEERATRPMEKLLWEIPGVEYVYSTSSPGMSMAVVRFYVGQDEEKSIVRLQSKLMANMDRIPPSVSPPLIKPRYIDDVPILALTFWGKDADHYTLRRVAAEVDDLIKREENVSITTLIGGYRRQLTVGLDPVRLSAFGLDIGRISAMVCAANQDADAGAYPSPEGQVLVHVNGFLKNSADVEGIVVGVHDGKPVYLRDVAAISDGPAEPDQYVFFGMGPAASEKGLHAGRCGFTRRVSGRDPDGCQAKRRQCHFRCTEGFKAG